MIQRQNNNLTSGDTVVQLVRKFRTQKSASKVMASVFWDKDGMLVVQYLKKGATISASLLIPSAKKVFGFDRSYLCTVLVTSLLANLSARKSYFSNPNI